MKKLEIYYTGSS